MSLISDVKEAFKEARKNKDKLKTGILGCLIGDLETLSLRTQKPPYDPDVIAMVKSFQKNNLKSQADIAAVFDRTAVETEDMAKRNKELQEEYNILSEILPKQLISVELTTIIESFIKTNEGASVGDIMKYLKQTYGGQYDGKMASDIARGYN